ERVVDDTVVEEEADSVTLEEDVAKEPITNEEAFYIVSGVFSTRENAQKHLDGLKNKNKNVVEVLGKFYATIGTYKTDAAATEAKKAAKSDCWVLKVKNNKPIYKEQ
ncbi:MAG: SPOR domain-containing protein, partial [Rikenellaceae bacterium]